MQIRLLGWRGRRAAMSIRFPTDIEDEIRQRVASGQYRNDVDVLRAAMNALDERDKRSRLRAALAVGAQGEGIPFTSNTMNELLREADEADRLGLPINLDVCS